MFKLKLVVGAVPFCFSIYTCIFLHPYHIEDDLLLPDSAIRTFRDLVKVLQICCSNRIPYLKLLPCQKSHF